MQRSQVGDFLDGLDDLVGNDDGGGELLAAMDDAVADSADLVEGLQDAGLFIGQGFENQADCLIVIGHRNLIDFLACVGHFILISDDGSVDADPLAKTFCKKSLGLGIDDLEFQGRAAAVDNQNIHFYQSFRNHALNKHYCNTFRRIDSADPVPSDHMAGPAHMPNEPGIPRSSHTSGSE